MNGFGLYQAIRKLDDKVKICFLTAASDVYYEDFGKQAFPNIDEKCIIQKPIENELLIKRIKSIICWLFSLHPRSQQNYQESTTKKTLQSGKGVFDEHATECNE